MQAIADEGGVAVQTVYAIFRNKRTLLEELLDVTIAGDDERVAVNQREWMRLVFTGSSAPERLRSYAAAVRLINERAGDLLGVVEVAASVDPDLVELAQVTENRRRTGARSVIDALKTVGPLRTGISDEHAVDIMGLLNSPATFRQLVCHAGWSLDDYEAWLATAMTEQLLPSEQ